LVGCSSSKNEEVVVTQEINIEESPEPEVDVIDAKEVGEILLSNGIPFIEMDFPFPPGTYITDGPTLSSAERNAGMVSKAMAASEHNGDLFDWRIEVYNSITARNNARLQMVRDCPGCAYLAECGEILIYIPDITEDERKRGMTRQAYTILRDNLQCE